MDRVLVTGGAGFIGSTLVDRLLAQDYEVDVVDDLSRGTLANLSEARSIGGKRLHVHKLDICDIGLEELVLRRRPSLIVHLAAQSDVRLSMVDPVADATTNIVGSLRVLESARKAGVTKVIYAASAGLYGEVDPSRLPASEDEPRRSESNYGVSKASVLEYLDIYRRTYDLEYTALALANVFGPRQGQVGEAGVVTIFAKSLMAGEQCSIYGSGKQTRDFVYVDDVVDAFVRAFDQGGGMVLNIGTGIETNVVDLYQMVAKAVGVDQVPQYAPGRPGEITRSAVDARRASWYLRWHPFTTVASGIDEVARWLRT
ncbi:MAG: NAD-dependent epimerase/dehydratase family protein [Ferrimicrobium sp.]